MQIAAAMVMACALLWQGDQRVRGLEEEMALLEEGGKQAPAVSHAMQASLTEVSHLTRHSANLLVEMGFE